MTCRRDVKQRFLFLRRHSDSSPEERRSVVAAAASHAKSSKQLPSSSSSSAAAAAAGGSSHYQGVVYAGRDDYSDHRAAAATAGGASGRAADGVREPLPDVINVHRPPAPPPTLAHDDRVPGSSIIYHAASAVNHDHVARQPAAGSSPAPRRRFVRGTTLGLHVCLESVSKSVRDDPPWVSGSRVKWVNKSEWVTGQYYS